MIVLMLMIVLMIMIMPVIVIPIPVMMILWPMAVVVNFQVVEQFPPRLCHFPHRAFEGCLVGLRRFVETADLANELQGGVVQLLVGRISLGAAKPFDVSAHGWESREFGLRLDV